MRWGFIKITQIYEQDSPFQGRQSVYFVKTEPKLACQVTKSNSVTRPVAEEVNQAMESLLEDNPPTTVCLLIAEDFKLVFAIRVDCIDSTLCSSRLQQLVAVCKAYQGKMNHHSKKKNTHDKNCSNYGDLWNELEMIYDDLEGATPLNTHNKTENIK